MSVGRQVAGGPKTLELGAEAREVSIRRLRKHIV
jgi:hypothetical protein